MKKFSNRILLVLLLVFSSLQMMGAEVEVQTMTKAVPGSYDFYLYLPPSYDRAGEAKPLILCLHGASCCGGAMTRARRYGVIDALARGMDIDAVVVAPHNNGGAWSPKKLADILDFMEARYNVDHNRIYVFGMSLGGYGTLDFVNAYPERVAAAIAMCGGCSSKNIDGLGKLPLWIIHGTADRDVKVGVSREIVSRLKNANADSMLFYSELPGVDHGQPCRMYYHGEGYEWLFRHTLDKRQVDRSFTLTTASLRRPYEKNSKRKYIDRKGRIPQLMQPREGEKDEAFENQDAETEEVVTDGEASDVEETAEPVKAEPKKKQRYHTIKKGDTLSSIAKRNHTTVKKLCRDNGLKPTSTLKLGRRIKI